MRRPAALAAAALAAALAGVGPTPARAGEPGTFGIRLVDVPADQAGDPRAHQYVLDHLDPGDTLRRRVEVANHSDGPVTVALYAAAADVQGGRFLFGEGRAANELTGWTAITPSSLTLPPGGNGTATVTVAVGDGPTSGEHYGVVWAEARAPAPGGGIATVHRVGVRMYVSIGPAGEPPSDFEIRSLTASRGEEGRPVVTASVENTGQRALDLTGSLRLDDGPGGTRAGPFDMEVGTTLAPGETAPVTVLLEPGIAAGPWHATVTVRSGALEKRAEATLTFPDERARSAGAVAVRSLDADGDSLLRSALAAGVSLLTAGGVVALLRRRRGVSAARRPPAPPPGPDRAGRLRPPRPRRPRVPRHHSAAPAHAAPARRPRPPRRRGSPGGPHSLPPGRPATPAR